MHPSHFFAATIMYDRCVTASSLRHVALSADLYEHDLYTTPSADKYSNWIQLGHDPRTRGCSFGSRHGPLPRPTRAQGAAIRTCSYFRGGSSRSSHGGTVINSRVDGRLKDSLIYPPHPAGSETILPVALLVFERFFHPPATPADIMKLGAACAVTSSQSVHSFQVFRVRPNGLYHGRICRLYEYVLMCAPCTL